MLCNVLAVGDVVGESGVDYLNRHLRSLKKTYSVDFTVVNGENAAGVGLLPRHADQIFDAGADVITLGNHTWNKMQIADYLDDNRYILRPDNYASPLPGRGYGVFDGPRGLRIGVINLMGRYELDSNLENPFTRADRILSQMDADLILVDFHAEASSEKLAFGYYLDGRASAVWGTHTHVPTADQGILPKGTGYCTDLGMTGPKKFRSGHSGGVLHQFVFGRTSSPVPGSRRALQAVRRALHPGFLHRTLRGGETGGYL
jgi:metallophosphoesterase (TIGR00282 family)